MRLLKLKLNSGYHSLQPGFEILFHSVHGSVDDLISFHPLCLAGLNGSGKSNILEVLACIFYHMECCALKNKPDNFNFTPEQSTPDSFEIVYLIGSKNVEQEKGMQLYEVQIIKKKKRKPVMTVCPYLDKSLFKDVGVEYDEHFNVSPSKEYLPDMVIGYSSGENEILSRPFIKTQLIQYDEYIQSIEEGIKYEKPESSLLYMDYEMCQTILLTNLLYQPTQSIEKLNAIIGLKGLESFRININLHHYEIKNVERRNKEKSNYYLTQQINHQLDKLKKCATSYFEYNDTLAIDFFVNDATQKAVRFYFGEDPFNFFNTIYILNVLNRRIVEHHIKEDVYASKGYYTSGKLPSPKPSEQVFHFLDYFINVKRKNDIVEKKLLMRQLSDGEQQFLHTLSICVLLKNHRTLILLDEPETHFNPEWRSKFMNILNDNIVVDGEDGESWRKEILLTTHSPFILSDCKSEDVIVFEKTNTGKIDVCTAKDKGINTYGASVDFLLKNFFEMRLISDQSFASLEKVIQEGDIHELTQAIDYFGESTEKQFLYRRIYELMEKDVN